MRRLPPVRRFEMGASACGFDDFLKNRGWVIKWSGTGNVQVRREHTPGRWARMTQKQLVDLLDKERRVAGLEPIRKR